MMQDSSHVNTSYKSNSCFVVCNNRQIISSSALHWYAACFCRFILECSFYQHLLLELDTLNLLVGLIVLPVLVALTSPTSTKHAAHVFSDTLEFGGFILVSSYIVVLNVFVLSGSFESSVEDYHLVDLLGLQ
jgi:hypothetical protein